MEVTVTGRHIEITPAIREYAEAKVAKLPRYFDRITAIEVIGSKPDHRQLEVEIKVTAERAEPFIAKTAGPDLYACIDLAVEKLERQLSTHKDRVRDHKGHTPMSGPATKATPKTAPKRP